MNPKSPYEESELITLLKKKDNQAFSYLYNNYGNALYGIVKQIVSDEEIGNDVLQEVFISIWRKIDSYDPSKGRLFTWMLNIARNAAIDQTRSKNYQQSLRQVPITDNELSHPIIRPGYDDYGLKKVINKLKNEERILIDCITLR